MLSGDEIKALLRGEPILRDDTPDEADNQKPRSSVPKSGGLGEIPQGA
jgi:cell division protease FtsH